MIETTTRNAPWIELWQGFYNPARRLVPQVGKVARGMHYAVIHRGESTAQQFPTLTDALIYIGVSSERKDGDRIYWDGLFVQLRGVATAPPKGLLGLKARTKLVTPLV
jgi:hypothetical protein